MDQNILIKPHKLKPGDTIGIISPAGSVRQDNQWESTIAFFESKGYKVKIAHHARDKKAYLAGNDSDRVKDLINFFEDKEIKAIICSRGGYGVYRILSHINYEIIRKNPKIFVGYSDITSLLLTFLENANLITFHGPLALSDFGGEHINSYTESGFFNILEGNVEIGHKFLNPLHYECINPGSVRGNLVGGNLAVLSGLLGTPYFPDLTGKILFLEDVGEPLYKIDRMLMQLKLAGVFDRISGLLFGEFTSVVNSDDPDINKLNPIDIIRDVLEDIKIPAGYGFPAGHGTYKATLPLGINYYFNSEDFTLSIEEEYLS